MALTELALEALKSRDKPYTLADDRGLYVEVFPTGGIVWRYRYRLDGKQEKLTLGKYPALTLRNARSKRDEAAQAVALGHSPDCARPRHRQCAPIRLAMRSSLSRIGMAWAEISAMMV